MPKVRKPTHSGTWYTSDEQVLECQLTSWLLGVDQVEAAPRAIIGPHAGYRYSGKCAAYAYRHIDKKQVRRIFLLGPSHHVYTPKCCLSGCTTYRTPLGDISVDQAVNEELSSTGEFEKMGLEVEEDEHSLEMHLPYIQKVMGDIQYTLVPIMVGSLTAINEKKYGKILAPYLEEPENFFIISSDFCHWGRRFNYTFYDRKHGQIHQSIEHLDREGMRIIEQGDPGKFAAYLATYENTICGRHPIAVLLHSLQQSMQTFKITFTRYEQSSKCMCMSDSSVSYASAVVVLD
eukprot:CAMPEP_0183829256 /NCGR_PEP_ID=MMETSP0807_2-20130328/3212_1 /TAXON_ID=88271 /ORGANISM="Picocystis salinarum, Strain CCMP1897" /LENGTH=289 /DNA_ID=CAMNT_0026074463 /DNA_START=161 /DNA_END=1030 /DNA_ORIENTATION=-